MTEFERALILRLRQIDATLMLIAIIMMIFTVAAIYLLEKIVK